MTPTPTGHSGGGTVIKCKPYWLPPRGGAARNRYKTKGGVAKVGLGHSDATTRTDVFLSAAAIQMTQTGDLTSI